MVFRALGVTFILLISMTSFAQGRKPAVEDFVGIEVDEPQVMPQGTESLYNLEQDLSKLEVKSQQKDAPAPAPETVKAFDHRIIFGVSLVFGLPLMVWFFVMAHLKRKASVESASNIEVLEKYRKEREKQGQEKVRKVS